MAVLATEEATVLNEEPWGKGGQHLIAVKRCQRCASLLGGTELSTCFLAWLISLALLQDRQSGHSRPSNTV